MRKRKYPVDELIRIKTGLTPFGFVRSKLREKWSARRMAAAIGVSHMAIVRRIKDFDEEGLFDPEMSNLVKYLFRSKEDSK